MRTWDFRIAGGIGANPLLASGDDASDNGIVAFPDCSLSQGILSKLGVDIIDADPARAGFWPWVITRTGTPTQASRSILYSLSTAMFTARAAELVTPILEAHPELYPLVRAYTRNADNVAMVLRHFGDNGDGPLSIRALIASGQTDRFSDLFRFGVAGEDIDALASIDLSHLEGDPSFLFSYDALRILTSFYSSDRLVVKGLQAKLYAAERAESLGDPNAKRASLNAYSLQVMALTGRAFTQAQARVLLALAKTL
jgi:hypothetical protein